MPKREPGIPIPAPANPEKENKPRPRRASKSPKTVEGGGAHEPNAEELLLAAAGFALQDSPSVENGASQSPRKEPENPAEKDQVKKPRKRFDIYFEEHESEKLRAFGVQLKQEVRNAQQRIRDLSGASVPLAQVFPHSTTDEVLYLPSLRGENSLAQSFRGLAQDEKKLVGKSYFIAERDIERAYLVRVFAFVLENMKGNLSKSLQEEAKKKQPKLYDIGWVEEVTLRVPGKGNGGKGKEFTDKKMKLRMFLPRKFEDIVAAANEEFSSVKDSDRARLSEQAKKMMIILKPIQESFTTTKNQRSEGEQKIQKEKFERYFFDFFKKSGMQGMIDRFNREIRGEFKPLLEGVRERFKKDRSKSWAPQFGRGKLITAEFQSELGKIFQESGADKNVSGAAILTVPSVAQAEAGSAGASIEQGRPEGSRGLISMEQIRKQVVDNTMMVLEKAWEAFCKSLESKGLSVVSVLKNTPDAAQDISKHIGQEAEKTVLMYPSVDAGAVLPKIHQLVREMIGVYMQENDAASDVEEGVGHEEDEVVIDGEGTVVDDEGGIIVDNEETK